jgi:hypothetical protein
MTDMLDRSSPLRELLHARCSGRSELRVVVTFRDVIELVELHDEAATGAHAIDTRDWAKLDESEGEKLVKRGWRADALHRSVIEASHRAMSVLLHELTGRPTHEVPVQKQLERPSSAKFEHRDAWQGLYCLATYRNKIVTHHEVPRKTGGALTDRDGIRRLAPLPEDFHVSKPDARRLREIRDSTSVAVGENDFDLLEKLFYAIPVTFGGPQSDFRREIDKIAERGGVKSPTVPDILNWLERGATDALRFVVPP